MSTFIERFSNACRKEFRDCDCNTKCEEMCQCLKKRGYPDSAVTTGKWRPRNRPKNHTTNVTELRNQQNSIHPHLPSTKPCSQNAILKNFEILRNDPETEHISPLSPLISFKCDKKEKVTFY